MRVLIVEDDKNLGKILQNELLGEGFDVGKTNLGREALERAETEEYDVVLLDLNLPDMNGLDVLKDFRAREVAVEVIILTGNGTVSAAVEAMKLGAYDFLTKPFDMEELKEVLKKAFEKKQLVWENQLLKTQIKRQSATRQIITGNPRMLEILENVKRVAQSDLPVLITGESGVGKELFAKAIHDSSKKSEGPFVPINCGAIPENMMESELFGHEKGAFTGAHTKKLGLFEVSNQGTLFLDEIGELNFQLQVKLLRAIETERFFRVGGTKDVRVDVKLISATNKDIRAETEKGNFRTDLYYRISPLTLEIPPLRERKEDIPLLVEGILKENPLFRGKRLSEGVWKTLNNYAWPGNVRELQNVIHRIFLLTKSDVIEAKDLPGDLSGGSAMASQRMEDIERGHILNVLREAGGQKGKAAEVLGLDPKTLYRKLLTYQIRNDEFSPVKK